MLFRSLADFLDAHRLRIGRAFLDDTDPAADPLLANRWMQEIQDRHVVSEETRTIAANATAKGNEVRAFCWELAFPELFFEPEPEGQGVRRRERPGFDAMVGNPPWDKLEPKRKEFFAQYDPAIRDFQGQTLARRITQLAPVGSEADLRWQSYDSIESSLAKLLINGGAYQHQVVEVNGEKTGGKPDLFKIFLERFHQLSREGDAASVAKTTPSIQVPGCLRSYAELPACGNCRSRDTSPISTEPPRTASQPVAPATAGRRPLRTSPTSGLPP